MSYDVTRTTTNCSCHLGCAPCSGCMVLRFCETCRERFYVDSYDDPEVICYDCYHEKLLTAWQAVCQDVASAKRAVVASENGFAANGDDDEGMAYHDLMASTASQNSTRESCMAAGITAETLDEIEAQENER